ncbi:MAG: hypothetical protein C4567_17435 [Deltaproteobacteria bacterium]|nr:MAG: hypothetical protein C4567_17435 [Deltaproteobacteria bacterium]
MDIVNGFIGLGFTDSKEFKVQGSKFKVKVGPTFTIIKAHRFQDGWANGSWEQVLDVIIAECTEKCPGEIVVFLNFQRFKVLRG